MKYFCHSQTQTPKNHVTVNWIEHNKTKPRHKMHNISNVNSKELMINKNCKKKNTQGDDSSYLFWED